MARAPLTLWMNGLLVGTWSEIRGIPTLTYAPSWVTAPEGLEPQRNQARHWDSLARRAGLESATPLLSEIAQQTPAALSRVNQRIPKGFPARIQDSILNGLTRSISTLS